MNDLPNPFTPGFGQVLYRLAGRGRIIEEITRALDFSYRVFLTAMLEDPHESAVADIIKRIGKSSNAAQATRRRLIDLGVIGERGRGYVGFDLPYFKDYLAKRAQ